MNGWYFVLVPVILVSGYWLLMPVITALQWNELYEVWGDYQDFFTRKEWRVQAWLALFVFAFTVFLMFHIDLLPRFWIIFNQK